MARLRRVLIVAIAAVSALALTACEDYQIQWFLNDATPEQQNAVVAALQQQARARAAAAARGSATDCVGEMRRNFPSHVHGSMMRIMERESKAVSIGTRFVNGKWFGAKAKNPHSSARGCFQMLSMHDWRLPPGGSMYHAGDSAKAARSLYDADGLRPWR